MHPYRPPQVYHKTGGTTAISKASYVTREEFQEGAQSYAVCLVRAGPQPGDRVANLLHGGNAFRGFLDLCSCLDERPDPKFPLVILRRPIGEPNPDIANTLLLFLWQCQPSCAASRTT